VIHETHEYSIVPENIALCRYDYQPVGGYLEVPELPGIGQEINEDILSSSRVVTVR